VISHAHTHIHTHYHTGFIAKHYGWQWGMWAPGTAALVVGMFALTATRYKCLLVHKYKGKLIIPANG